MNRSDSAGRHSRIPAPARSAAAVLIVLALLVLTACTASGGDPGEEPTDGVDADGSREVRAEGVDTVFAVNVTPAVRGPIADYIEINGDVQTTTSIDVYSNTAGEVARLYVRVGQRVTADELLAEIDPSRPGQNFALSPVRSPIAGTVTRLPVRVGSQVTLAAPIGEVARTTELEVVVQLAERFISRVSTGLAAEILLDAFPGETFAARVSELNPVVDPLTRTLEVKLRFSDTDPRIRAGMFAEVRIITERRDDVVKVPADVLVRRFGEEFVFVVGDDGIAERRVVSPGIEIDDTLEITAGLAADEMVVYQGQSLLEDGVRVRVIDTVEPLATAANS